MKWQLESLYSNIVWFLVEAPNYKRNIRGDGKLEFYVAKTIAKCYSLKLCFNYGKPFQQWSQSNLSCHSYLLQCISFMRFNNQTFSQQRTLQVDDNLLIGYDVGILSSVKIQQSTQFQMKIQRKMQYILGVKVLSDCKNRKIVPCHLHR